MILLFLGKLNFLGDSNSSKNISLLCPLNFVLQWKPV